MIALLPKLPRSRSATIGRGYPRGHRQTDLLLADEPTGNLHTDQGREIMELFKKLNCQGTTIVHSHSENNAACGNRIIRLKDGWMEKS